MAQLNAEAISAGYGVCQVLHGINLSLHEGEVVALLGPNGSGKTTLIRSLCKVLKPTAGTVCIDNKSIQSMSHLEVARQISLVPQREETLFDFTVQQMIAMGRFPWGDTSSEITERATDRMQLSALSSRLFSTLSGGERQRVLLARALAQDTPIILMDEPTAHMDVGYQVASLGLLNELSAEGRTICVAVHDLNLASGFASRAVLLFGGRIVLDAATNDVLTSNEIERVFGARFSRVADQLSQRTILVPEFLNPQCKSPNPKIIHLIGGGGSAAPILAHLWQAGHQLTLGVAHEGDSDLSTANKLGIQATTVAPFSFITAEISAIAERQAEKAEWVLLCSAPFAEGNLENLKLAGRLLAKGKKIVLLPEPEIWDYTKGEAEQLRRDLLDSGAVESNLQDLLEILDEVYQ